MLTSFPVLVAVGTALGFLAGLGVGGGSLLILWLTFVMDMEHADARGINLLFFLPAAIIACLFRWRQGDLPWRRLLPAIIAGSVGAGIFSVVSFILDITLMKKLFGFLLLLTGIRELIYKPKKKEGT